MRARDGGSFLGSGGNGCARVLLWGSAPVVRKKFHHDGALLFRMQEVHAQGVVHNNLKADNTTGSGGVHGPVLHVIDLGWAFLAGHVA
ncbi:hypothetical protein E2C01_016786 [Portunus trituberculatus]|uniref:Protein kinase domain-containing protein n=1 Tax=Portunus trituberculatus TaxID=210409 RepID=A0A5B7DR64_PORTR|nr:hypothetical protein [Portunus trituberculatus]